jgi:hypothetical protein
MSNLAGINWGNPVVSSAIALVAIFVVSFIALFIVLFLHDFLEKRKRRKRIDRVVRRDLQDLTDTRILQFVEEARRDFEDDSRGS